MKKIFCLLIFGLLFGGLVLSGCKSERIENNVAGSPRIVQDLSGKNVEVPRDIKKIAVTPIPWATVVYCIDQSTERLAAVNPGVMGSYKGKFLERFEKNFGNLNTKMISSDFSMNIESLVKEDIDVAIIWVHQEKDAENLKKVGIPSLCLKNGSLEELNKSFAVVGKLLQKEDRAKFIIDKYDTTYKFLKSREAEIRKAHNPSIMFLRNRQLRIQGNDNFYKEIFQITGGNNLTGSSKTVTMEEVLKIDPEIILLSNFDTFIPEDFYQNRIAGQDWSNVRAVKDRRVYKVPNGIYRWDAPGVETPLMMKWLARLFHPEIFNDVNIRKETELFLEDYMGYRINEGDIAQIFADEANKNSRSIR